MLDDKTRGLCRLLDNVATREGWDLFETMDRVGLLTTVEQRRKIEQDILSSLYRQLEDQQHTSLAQLGGAQTVTGTVRGILRYIELFAEGLEQR